MHMLTERLQILIGREQRQRLEEEARRAGISMGALVRQAIDARVGVTAVDERVRAVAAIDALAGTFLPPAELDRILGEERLQAARGE
jgi:hypothetical protein